MPIYMLHSKPARITVSIISAELCCNSASRTNTTGAVDSIAWLLLILATATNEAMTARIDAHGRAKI